MSFKLQEKEVLGENVTTTEDQILLMYFLLLSCFSLHNKV